MKSPMCWSSPISMSSFSQDGRTFAAARKQQSGSQKHKIAVTTHVNGSILAFSFERF